MAAVVLAVVVLAISLLCAQRQKSRMRPAPEAVKTKKQHVASAECEQEHEDGDAPAERNFNARFSERRPLRSPRPAASASSWRLTNNSTGGRAVTALQAGIG